MRSRPLTPRAIWVNGKGWRIGVKGNGTTGRPAPRTRSGPPTAATKPTSYTSGSDCTASARKNDASDPAAIVALAALRSVARAASTRISHKSCAVGQQKRARPSQSGNSRRNGGALQRFIMQRAVPPEHP